jgi:TetR/AcrR family transcriptional regulator, cholesterol catabolism regulator
LPLLLRQIQNRATILLATEICFRIRTNVRTMVSPATRPRAHRSVKHQPSEPRFDRQLGKILEHATEVFCEKGYAGASMRDLSRATGMSLAGMYHYFRSKERLLYLIQKHTFSTILSSLRDRLFESRDTAHGIRMFIDNHLEYFLAHQQAMKVLSHEDEVLEGEYGREIARIKREYYQTCRELLDRYKKQKGLEFDSRIAVLSLFGMMNWIYTWYNPRLDGKAERLAQDMSKIFFKGIGSSD